MLIIRLDENFTDTSLPVLKRDKLLENDGGGVLWLADFSRDYTWSSAAAPGNGDVIGSLTEANPGAMRLANGGTVALAGNGLDFATAKKNTFVEIPATVLSTLWGGGARNQYFMACFYAKLPAQAGWNAAAGVLPMFQASPAAYTTQPDLLLVGQVSTPAISFRRQTAIGTNSGIDVALQSADFGSLAQVAYWRTASGAGARVKTAAGTRSGTGAVGVNNAANFSANVGQLGIGPGFWTEPLSGQANCVKFSMYRAFIEDLVTSGRDPATVLDADWSRVIEEGLFT
jgi:hypothetical protein